MVTIDDTGCQTNIVQTLWDADPDYLLAIKRSQCTSGSLQRHRTRCLHAGETIEHNGGRTERRTYTVLGGPGLRERVANLEAWPSLRSLVRGH